MCKFLIRTYWNSQYKTASFPHSTRVNYQRKQTKLDLLLKRVEFLYSFSSRPRWLFTLAQYLLFSNEMTIEQVVNQSMLQTTGFTL